MLLPPALLLSLCALQDPAAKPADPKPAETKPADAKPDEPKALPKGFPKPDEPRGVRVKEASALDGYVLLAPLNSKSIHLVDLDGKVAHTWKTSCTPGAATYFLPNGHLLRCGQVDPNPRFHGGGIGGRIQELDWDGNVVWNFDLDNEVLTQHHDVKPLPNGNMLMIAWEYHSKEEVIAHGRMSERVGDDGLWTDTLIEIKPSRPIGGSVVWMWRSWDHLTQDQDKALPDYSAFVADDPARIDINADCRWLPKEESEEDRAKKEKMEKEMKRLGYAGGDDDGPKKSAAKPADAKTAAAKSADAKPADAKVADAKPGDAKPGDAKPGDPAAPPKGPKNEADWMHMNAVDYLPEQDLIVFSSPHLCEIFVIDHSTTTAEAATESGGKWKHGGGLLYRYGNPRNYGKGEASDKKLFYQHNVQWLPVSKSGELHVLVYNNGAERPTNEYSSVEELALPFDATKGFTKNAKGAFGPDAPAWSYSEPDKFFSPFISGAQRLPNGNTLVCEGVKGRAFEVDHDGKIVWDFWSPLGGDIEPSKTGGRAPPNALFRALWLPKDHAGLKGKL
jgi:Arylsulfotransferase (ASST)